MRCQQFMSDIEYSVITSDVMKSFDCMSIEVLDQPAHQQSAQSCFFWWPRVPKFLQVENIKD